MYYCLYANKNYYNLLKSVLKKANDLYIFFNFYNILLPQRH